MTTAAPATRIVPPSTGREFHIFGDRLTMLLTGQETGGRFTMFTAVVTPGGGPPPHVHTREEEWFFILEGKAEFLRDGQWLEAPVGTTVHTPAGVAHTFRNPGTTPLKMLVHAALSGFETFAARCHEVCARPGPPDMDRLLQIAREHGIQIIGA